MNNCNSCNRNNKCDPARYSQNNCSMYVSPYDPTQLVWDCGGMIQKFKLPEANETDTILTTNTTNSTLDYTAEKHRDVITGTQLGDIITLEDLRDTEIDATLAGTCYELVYHKYAECGEGCESVSDRWLNFNINSDGGKQDYLEYVRGANAYGCPTYLTPPANKNQFYFTGWRQDGEHKEFGYMQPKEVSGLPTDSNGNVIAMSIDPTTKEPVVGPLPADCAIRNLIANLASEVWGGFRRIQGTPGFTASFNKVTGDFTISWDDWKDTAHTQHVGHGDLYGKLNWTTVFNTTNGTVTWRIDSVSFHRVHWDKDLGAHSNIYLTIKGVNAGTGGQTTVLDRYHFTGESSWNVDLGVTVPYGLNITNVGPQESRGGFDFVYFLVNWSLENDEGFQQINFKNTLTAWISCN